MDTLIEAVGALKAGGPLDPAIDTLIAVAVRQRKALQFYANRDNYLDKVPCLTDPETGLLGRPDNAFTALVALGENLSLGALIGVRGDTAAQWALDPKYKHLDIEVGEGPEWTEEILIREQFEERIYAAGIKPKEPRVA